MLKRLVVLGMAVVVLGFAANVGAVPVVQLNQAPGLGDGSGGAFWADLNNDQSGDDGDFLTFCLERNEFFTPGVEYYYSTGTGAVGGGYAGGNPDPIDSVTINLYTLFLNGTLGVDTDAEGNALQEAIWFEEQELNVNVTINSLSLLAQGYLAQAAAFQNQNNYLGVKVMNVYSKQNGEQKQSMLMVPEPGMFLLLGPGLLGLGLLRRRMKKA